MDSCSRRFLSACSSGSRSVMSLWLKMAPSTLMPRAFIFASACDRYSHTRTERSVSSAVVRNSATSATIRRRRRRNAGSRFTFSAAWAVGPAGPVIGAGFSSASSSSAPWYCGGASSSPRYAPKRAAKFDAMIMRPRRVGTSHVTVGCSATSAAVASGSTSRRCSVRRTLPRVKNSTMRSTMASRSLAATALRWWRNGHSCHSSTAGSGSRSASSAWSSSSVSGSSSPAAAARISSAVAASSSSAALRFRSASSARATCAS
mmetsp:Transcript_19726/g.61269  ORF Transcript_19726/g.61269 Transcript_19726/m.61269 type:complete len:261 (-) Transcript_19726:159-941(-)